MTNNSWAYPKSKNVELNGTYVKI